MLTAPWNFALTALFTLTGLYSVVYLFAHRPRARKGPGFDTVIIHATHALMSAAMIAMCWIMVFPNVANWAQIVVFGALALALVPGLWKAPLISRRVDVAGHIWLGGAMVWMIAAMPLLMAGMGGSHDSAGEHSSEHGGGGSMAMTTPAWVDAVNSVFVAGSLALALWWLYRTVTIRNERLHALCHCLMAAGMGAMLLLMNG